MALCKSCKRRDAKTCIWNWHSKECHCLAPALAVLISILIGVVAAPRDRGISASSGQAIRSVNLIPGGPKVHTFLMSSASTSSEAINVVRRVLPPSPRRGKCSKWKTRVMKSSKGTATRSLSKSVQTLS